MMGSLRNAARLLISRGVFDAAVAARAPGIPPTALESGQPEPWFRVHDGDQRTLQTHADFLIAKSGTSNLEAALLGTPMAVVYKTSALTFFLGRRFVKVPFLSPVNLLAGRATVPELLQGAATAERIAAAVERIVRDPDALSAQKKTFACIRTSLGERRPSEEVPAMIKETLHG
jgi:lipid-A-disaccharide synthase